MSSATSIATVRERQAPNAIEKMLGGRTADLTRLASSRMPADLVLQAAATAAVKTPAILKCTPASVYLAISDVLRWQLALGDGVYLIPYKNKRGDLICTAVPDYRGLMALLMRERVVSHIDAWAIYAGDEWEFRRGLTDQVTHVAAPASKRGALVGAWMRAILPSGVPVAHHMELVDIDARRAKSQSWAKGPCPAWYAKKTVIRDWTSRQPKSGVMASAALAAEAAVEESGAALAVPAHADDAQGTEEVEAEVIDETPDDPFAPLPAQERRRKPREERLATASQRDLIRKVARSHVITDEEREEIEECLSDPHLAWSDAGDRIEAVLEIVKQRKAAERAAAAEMDGAE